mmetsp:Transcript_22336/g.48806  ORF Transcript_22336/g.48806 Transcript_22336/m.48806 type:complete len:149 (-) Transcript_22336:290-736(-)
MYGPLPGCTSKAPEPAPAAPSGSPFPSEIGTSTASLVPVAGPTLPGATTAPAPLSCATCPHDPMQAAAAGHGLLSGFPEAVEGQGLQAGTMQHQEPRAPTMQHQGPTSGLDLSTLQCSLHVRHLHAITPSASYLTPASPLPQQRRSPV